jgi:uncharacterized protein
MRTRRYWRKLGCCGGLAVLAGVCIVLAFVAGMTAHYARRTLDPPRVTVAPIPADLAAQDVSFTASDGVLLRGWYVPPQNGAAIILVHGYGGARQHMLPEARILAGAGYGVLLFDLRGHGQSDEAQVTLGADEQRDLVAALDLVSAQPGVKQIGAVGFSLGGAVVAQVTAGDPRLGAVVIEAAFAMLEGVIEQEAGFLGPLTQRPAAWSIRRAGVDIDAVRPVDDLCAISPRPVFLIYGGADAVVPPGEQQAMFDAACDPVERWLIPGATHQNFSDVLPDEYAARLLAFFDRTLGPAAS